jgi:hypothetical protein
VTVWSIAFAPLVPLWALVLLGTLALVASITLVLRRARGAWFRALAFGLLFMGLCDPNLVRENRRPLKDIVAVVVDRSESQTIGQRPHQTELALSQLEARLKELGDVEVRVVETSPEESETEGTRLFAALRGALADAPPERVGGAFMITDGVVHDIPASAAALGFSAPLHALITGHEGERQRRIELIEAPRYGIVGKDQVIAARVLDSADRGEPVKLTVRHDGETIANIEADIGERIEVKTPIDHAGPNLIELEISPVEGELTTDSNRAVVNVDGVRDKLRVLLVSGKPHPGERMWRNLLKSDANVDLVHFTILRPPEKGGDGTPINELSLIAFPVADLFGPKVKDFDLIILDRYAQQSILPYIYLDNIANYVREGGALLMAEGPEFSTPEGLFYSPLGAIAPAEPTGEDVETPFRPRVSEEGLRHPVTRGLASLQSEGEPSWGRWFRLIGAKKSNGQTLMDGPNDKPLLVLSRVEKGRVGLLLSDQMWLWARNYDAGGPYLDLLRRVAHWLMKEPELEEEALRATAKGRDVTVERQSIGDKEGETYLVSPDGAKTKLALTSVAPGLSRTHMVVGRYGLYRAVDGDHVALVNVGPSNPLEMQDVVSTTDRLRPFAEATGGTVRRLASSAGADGVTMPRVVSLNPAPSYGGSDYVGIKRTGSTELIGARSTSLASGFFGLALLLGAVIAAWLRESGRLAKNGGDQR